MADFKRKDLLLLLENIFRASMSHLNFGIHHILDQFRASLRTLIDSDIDQKLLKNKVKIPESYKDKLWSSLKDFFFSQFPEGNLHSFPENKSDAVFDDFSFHWNNENQYYYKIPDYFFNYRTNIGDFDVRFITSYVEPEEGGRNKPKRYFVLASIPQPIKLEPSTRNLSLFFEFRSLTSIEKKIFSRNYQLNINKSILASIQHDTENPVFTNKEGKVFLDYIAEFASKRYSDRFIHPDLSTYLTKQAKLYGDEHFSLNMGELFDQQRYLSLLSLSQSFTLSAQLIIEKISSFENLKKKLYEKKKFIVKKEYIIPFSFLPPEMFQEIIKNEEQQGEWQKVLSFGVSSLVDLSLEEISSNKHLQNLPIYTKFYSGRMKRLLSNTISQRTPENQNILIKGENWHGLNLLRTKYAAKIKTIYIDPPYNTGAKDFVYSDNFQKASWLTMMQKRLQIAQNLLKSDGLFFSSIGDDELPNYSLLLEKLFPKRLDNIVWHKKTQPSYLSSELISVTEYILTAKNQEAPLKLMGSYGNQDKLTELINIGNSVCSRTLSKDHVIIGNEWTGTLLAGDYGKDKLQVELLNSQVIVKRGVPSEDLRLKSRFKWVQDRIDHEIELGGQIHVKSVKSLRPTIARSYSSPIIKAPTTLLSKKVNGLPTNTDANAELKALFQTSPFDYSKPSQLIKYLVRSATYFEKSGIILDFFAGSGTTAHAVLALNQEDQGTRNYILMEKEQYFESILLPRVQKLMFSSIWKDGQPLSEKGHPHIVKSLWLESFCDVFRNLTISEGDIMARCEDAHSKHLLQYSMDIENQANPISLNISSFADPFNYYMVASQNGVLAEENLDLVETFNFLLGLTVHTYEYLYEQNRDYQIISGLLTTSDDKNGEKEELILIVWRSITDLDVPREIKFLEHKYFSKKEYKTIYFNALSPISKGKVLDNLFQELMFVNL